MIVTTELGTYARATFSVNAVRVTARNVREISEWVGGSYVWPKKGAPYVTLPVRGNGRAYIGDWVTRLIGDGETSNFRVYNNQTFETNFRQIMDDAEKYAKVHELLMKIRTAQDVTTYYGETSEGVVLLVEQTAHEICNLFQRPA